MNKPRIKKRSMQRADIYKTHGDNGLVKRISGIKKVSAFKDGFLILIEILKLFFMYKIFRNQKK